MADENSLKREHRIDSSDAARPAAQLGDEPQHYAQGLKPKPRVIVSVEYEELVGETVPRGGKDISGRPMKPAKLILRTTTYDDGTLIDTTVGEDSGGYQDYLKGIENKDSGQSGSTRLRTQTKKPTAPKKSSKE